VNEIETDLRFGPHTTRDKGMCAMEFVAWVADEPHSDKPKCVAADLQRFMVDLNDALDYDQRQMLKPYLGRCIGTKGDGLHRARYRVYREIVGQPWGDLPTDAGTIVGCYGDDPPYIRAVLERLLPTEELPEVTRAIQEKVGCVA
jgi:hypothetical protein